MNFAARLTSSGPKPGARSARSDCRTLLLVGLLLLSALVGAGCGGGDEASDETGVEQSAGEAAKSEQPSPQVQLRRFLMRKDEEPGFRPVEQPRTETGVEAFVKVEA
jgi:hypothetical protein